MTAASPTFPPSSTVGVLRSAERRLAAAGCDSPRLDAELLLAHALGTTRERLVVDAGRSIEPAEGRRLESLLARRERREPVAYILGRRGFRHIELVVDPRVLVPRPETELLVEVALEKLAPRARVVDVGTGSGAVALALKHERPDLRVVATDASADALAVARANAQHLGLVTPEAEAVPGCGRSATDGQDGVTFFEGHLLDPVPGRLDAVVANLPYVADSDWVELPPDVAQHEPRLALAGGRDGLDLIRALVEQAAGVPWVALEVGEGQAARVANLLAADGRATEIRRDLAGIERVVVGRRP